MLHTILSLSAALMRSSTIGELDHFHFSSSEKNITSKNNRKLAKPSFKIRFMKSILRREKIDFTKFVRMGSPIKPLPANPYHCAPGKNYAVSLSKSYRVTILMEKQNSFSNLSLQNPSGLTTCLLSLLHKCDICMSFLQSHFHTF